MLFASDFRNQARNALSGKWGVVMGTGFIATLLGANGDTFRTNNDSYMYHSTYCYFPDVNYYIPDLIFDFTDLVSAIMIYALILLFIGGAATLGYAQFNLNIIERRNPKFSDLFTGFHRFWDGFLMQFLTNLFIALWSLLLIVPGIIAYYRYAMTPYILLENPDFTALEAIGRSKEIMHGNKARLFCLDFSFFGWFILCLFTLGIGFLWLVPYVNAARAAFYHEIRYNPLNS